MTRAAILVRSARMSRSLTQAELAQKTRVHQGNISEIENGRDLSVSTLEKLLDRAGYTLFALPTVRADASETARVIRRELERGNKQGALRALIQLNDNLVEERGLMRGVLGLLEPESTRRRVWDAAIAGLVAWRLREENIVPPEWVEKDRYFLARPDTLNIDPADPHPDETVVPSELARRGVLVWEDTFQSV